ncbi:hypothetical protein GXP70_05615 [Paenibacillus lycopersici]|uniref:Restriction system protein Mrr-like N-terminal domain-containing protein n=1 Tax=Paenibacillus lycopersici TaxID=2704462 RepID=A0A6C0FTY6_9BACL|nr:winged helix-turn-helix domain-containing protein [Paenibacillus lycopersici]QHT59482.1 hypothetical protein GXP70_05615 [Paenibacillus lycopersici]
MAAYPGPVFEPFCEVNLLSGMPDYRGFLVPLLELLDDGRPRTMQAIFDGLALALNLSASDRSELVQCGRQYTYKNRIIAARTYLLRARFIAYATNDAIIVTEQGRRFLSASLPRSYSSPVT